MIYIICGALCLVFGYFTLAAIVLIVYGDEPNAMRHHRSK